MKYKSRKYIYCLTLSLLAFRSQPHGAHQSVTEASEQGPAPSQ